MGAINNYQGKKYTYKGISAVNDDLTVEQALQININEKPFSITMRTPGNDEDLIRGLLYSEDVYRGIQPLHIGFSEENKNAITEVNISIDENAIKPGYSNSRNFLSASSCGICGKTELESPKGILNALNSKLIELSDLNRMFDLMNGKQSTFKLSGGSHAAAVFNKTGELICVMEDIGRHNAVDKVIGYLLNNNLLDNAQFLTVSGRISYEIVSKAFAAKIPVLAAVSAPSSLAVDFAKELGITLLAFCRDHKATCYAHPQRVKDLS